MFMAYDSYLLLYELQIRGKYDFRQRGDPPYRVRICRDIGNQ
jgi:hypothetical protein